MNEIRALYQRIHKLESLCLSMEEFTNSGSWVYDEGERAIEFSLGASNLLGILYSDNPVPLTLLEGMCRASHRERLDKFFAAGHALDAARSVDILVLDFDGNQMKITLCYDTRANLNEVGMHGLIKSTP